MYIPSNSVAGFPFLHTLSSIYDALIIIDDAILTGVRGPLGVVLISCL